MAQGVAWAARELGVAATVVVPEQAPQTKLDAIERLGARVLKVPYERWWQTLVDGRTDEADGFFVHPVQDERVMAGNGTIGLELADQLPDADAVIVPWGGGGLFTGIASALAALRPETRVHAAEPETAAAVTAAVAAGEPREADYAPSFVDGAGAKIVLPAMWERAQPLLAGAHTVSLDATAAAVRLLAERARVIAEGAGALAVAAALSGERPGGQAGLHRLGRQHRRGPAERDPRRRDASLAGQSEALRSSGRANQTIPKRPAEIAVTRAVTAPLKIRSVTRKTTAVIPSARKTVPTIAKTFETFSIASLSRSRKRIRW